MAAFANLNLINFLLFMTCFHIYKKDVEMFQSKNNYNNCFKISWLGDQSVAGSISAH